MQKKKRQKTKNPKKSQTELELWLRHTDISRVQIQHHLGEGSCEFLYILDSFFET